jgi:hypothetical protein
MTMTTGSTGPSKPPVTDLKLPVNSQPAGITAGANKEFKLGRYLSEAEILADASIEAKPLNSGDSLQIRIKNFDYVYRWVNRSGQSGDLLRQRRMAGFTNATMDDVELDAMEEASVTGGSIVVGDLVLMKLPVNRYYAGIKASILKAQNAVQQQKKAAHSDAVPANAPVAAQDAVSVYTPSDKDLQARLQAVQLQETAAIQRAAGVVK